jgi:hypothetical protein
VEVAMTIQLRIGSPSFDAFVVGDRSWGTAGVRLQYDGQDPYAVSLEVMPKDGSRSLWTFARELLFDGYIDLVGMGNVVVCPAEDTDELLIEICDTNGHFIIRLAQHLVWDFLERTCLLVPLGTESGFLDIDGLITRLLAA